MKILLRILEKKFKIVIRFDMVSYTSPVQVLDMWYVFRSRLRASLLYCSIYPSNSPLDEFRRHVLVQFGRVIILPMCELSVGWQFRLRFSSSCLDETPPICGWIRKCSLLSCALTNSLHFSDFDANSTFLLLEIMSVVCSVQCHTRTFVGFRPE